MRTVFQITAVGLAGLAAYFIWARNTEAAFAAAVLGSVSFFLSVRSQVKERNRIREEERLRSESSRAENAE